MYYVSKNLQGVEANYTIMEKEMLNVVYDINKFRHYITSYPILIHTDHAKIHYLMNKLVVIEDFLDGYSCYKNLT